MPAKAETILHGRQLARLGAPTKPPEFIHESARMRTALGRPWRMLGMEGGSACAHDRGQTKTDSGLCGYCGGWNDRSGIVL